MFLYISLLTLLHVPSFQEKIGEEIGTYLSGLTGSEVKIGRLDISLLNQFVISDIELNDPDGKKICSIDRALARIEILPLFRDEIVFSSVQLFGVDAHLNKSDPSGPLNIQYLIDRFRSEDNEGQSLKLSLQTVVVRNGRINYDILSSPPKVGIFDLNHIHVDSLDLVCNVHSLQSDSIDIDINELTFKERVSNLSLSSFTSLIQSDSERLVLSNPEIMVNDNEISSSSIEISKFFLSGVDSSLSLKDFRCSVVPSTLQQFIPRLSSFSDRYQIQCDATFANDALDILDLELMSSDKGVDLLADLYVENISLSPTIVAKYDHANFSKSFLWKTNQILGLDVKTSEMIVKLGDLRLQGMTVYGVDSVQTIGLIDCSLGKTTLNCVYKPHDTLYGHIVTESLSLSPLLPSVDIRNLSMNMDVDVLFNGGNIPDCMLKGIVSHVEYSKYKFEDAMIDGHLHSDGFSGLLSVHSNEGEIYFDGKLDGLSSSSYMVDATLQLHGIRPSSFGLDADYAKNVYDMDGIAKLSGRNLDDLSGQIDINSISIQTPRRNYTFDGISLNLVQGKDHYKDLSLRSSILNCDLTGHIDYSTLPSVLSSLPNSIYPLIGKNPVPSISSNDNFDFSLDLTDSPYIHELLDIAYSFSDVLHVSGSIDNRTSHTTLDATCNSFTYDGIEVISPNLSYVSTGNDFTLNCSGLYHSDAKEYRLSMTSDCLSRKITSHIDCDIMQENPISCSLNISGNLMLDRLGDEIGEFVLSPSTVSMIGREFRIESEQMSVFKDHLLIQNLEVDDGDRSVVVNGTLSSDPADHLRVDINGTQIASLLEILSGNPPQLDGTVNGSVKLYDVLQSPRIDTSLFIDDLTFNKIDLGHAYVSGGWDNNEEGIWVRSQLIDEEEGGDPQLAHRVTSVNGHIYPSSDRLDLSIHFKNTSSGFLNGLIGRTFENISGDINGDIHISGPFSDISIDGQAYTNSGLTIRATKVRYDVSPKDPIQITTNSFIFRNVHISDKDGNTNILNGEVTHTGFHDFGYQFAVDLDGLLLYEETMYNSDKFMGKVYGDGTFRLIGSDGHPLNITADISPSRGSEFYYDAATPDAITGSNFLTFTEITPSDSVLIANGFPPSTYWQVRDSMSSVENTPSESKYRGDIFMNLIIHINHNCPVKLRMDNIEDGYITTYGTGVLQASYHNKGSFTMNGTYNIDDGRYRLYLQDIIYRDLVLQPGSNAVFNGNPFDAEIHLICWHTLNSVPLSDLTSATYTLNNRVKVVCILDITGHLGNMVFSFDLNLPNVSDETRSLVKSYISTEEEMNMQMIYLLGFGRFYTNEYARASGESNTNQAMNSLLSSTLSGQINQMLSNAIGTESNWNFGTGISTGERGWEDMDVEGTLSGKLLDDRLLINGNFGYRDNAMTNTSSFVGDFDVKWRIREHGNTYLKAYNLTNDRYFTKSTLNTQGIGVSYQRDFEKFSDLFKRRRSVTSPSPTLVVDSLSVVKDSTNIGISSKASSTVKDSTTTRESNPMLIIQ